MALEGTLQDMSLSDLFQVFRLGPKSGVLVINTETERGIIYVDKGRLIDGFVVQSDTRAVLATADEAVLRMLAWDDAEFVFRHDLSVAGRAIRIEQDGEWLVLEGMRRRSDPTRALPYHQLTLDTQLRLSPLPSNAESSVSLDVDQWRILSHAANNQDLRTICQVTGIEQEQAFRIVAELLSIGLVEVIQEAPRRPTAAPSAMREPANTSSEMALSGAAAPAPGGKATVVGRGLLNTIMRRISQL
jgi:ribosomal protein L12E/L44/L45/RPP1/RPP2